MAKHEKPNGAAAPRGRRYIGARETVGYILFEWAGGFDIGITEAVTAGERA